MYTPKLKDTTSPNALIALNRFALAIAALSKAAEDNANAIAAVEAKGEREPTSDDLVVKLRFGIVTTGDPTDEAAVKLMQEFEDAFKALCEDVTGVDFDTVVPPEERVATKHEEARRRAALTPAERQAEDSQKAYDKFIADGMPEELARMFSGLGRKDRDGDGEVCEECGEIH